MRATRLLPLLGLVTLGLGVAPLAAQTATPPAAGQPPAAGEPGARHGRGPHGPGARGPGRGEGRAQGRGGMQAVFRGITLTEAQRTQLRQIGERYRTERRTHMDAQRQQWQGQRGQPGTRPDSAARATRQTARTAQMEWARAAMQRQLREMRGVLTPEQQPTFDRNVAAMQQRMQERMQQPARVGRRGA